MDCFWCGFGGIRFPHVSGFTNQALKVIYEALMLIGSFLNHDPPRYGLTVIVVAERVMISV
jgi:hypothetical protein